MSIQSGAWVLVRRRAAAGTRQKLWRLSLQPANRARMRLAAQSLDVIVAPKGECSAQRFASRADRTLSGGWLRSAVEQSKTQRSEAIVWCYSTTPSRDRRRCWASAATSTPTHTHTFNLTLTAAAAAAASPVCIACHSPSWAYHG